jgi:hypothetical protein
MPTLKTGTAVFNLDAVMYKLDDPAGAVQYADEVTEEDEAKAVDQAVALDPDFTNETDHATIAYVDVSTLPKFLPYGVKAVAAKSLEEDGEVAFLTWFNQTQFAWYQESPYSEYADYRKTYRSLPLTIPANYKVTKIKVTPWKTETTLVFPLEEGDYAQAVEIYDTYTVEIEEGTPLDHDHDHSHGNNGGGGAGGE